MNAFLNGVNELTFMGKILFFYVYIYFCLLFQIPLTANCQTRKDLISKVLSYRDSTVMNTRYNVSADSLRKVVENYFSIQPFHFKPVVSEGLPVLMFRTPYALSDPIRDVEYFKSGSTWYRINWYDLYVKITIGESKDGRKLMVETKSVSQLRNYTNSQYVGHPKLSDVWSELAFHWYVFKALNNNYPELPAVLIARIESYNSVQKNTKKKLRLGQDY